eukprot:TRINITY_DN57887_c0_g1_i1.p1 TRINITY_DN57887_c0_g1~~TRINITY_DN57887_c0_g1_i1.p1  ORF type:complete len:336 (+),score=47.68 TRINITY_DN57887_c0_g1_i1:46-1053(+)
MGAVYRLWFLLLLNGWRLAEGDEKSRKENEALIRANCALDVSQTVWLLARVGVLMDNAVVKCDDNSKKMCAADIQGLIASFLQVGSFLTQTVSDCNANIDYKNPADKCTGNILKLTSAILQVGQASTLLSTGQCTSSPRRLKSLTQGYYNTVCVVDAAQASMVLGTAGTNIAAAADNCPTKRLGQTCAINVNNVIASFSFCASFLSAAASDCSQSIHGTTNSDAKCASSITKIIAALNKMASAANAIDSTCNPAENTQQGAIGIGITALNDPMDNAFDGVPATSAMFLSPKAMVSNTTAGVRRLVETISQRFGMGPPDASRESAADSTGAPTQLI